MTRYMDAWGKLSDAEEKLNNARLEMELDYAGASDQIVDGMNKAAETVEEVANEIHRLTEAEAELHRNAQN